VTVATQFLLQMGVAIVLARLLPPEDFGLIGLALIAINFGRIVSDLGLAQSMIQREELTSRQIRVGFTSSTLLGCAVAGCVFLIAPWFAGFFSEPRITDVLRVISGTFVFIGIGITSEALLKRRLEFSRLMAVEITSYGLGYGLVAVGMALAGYGVWSLVGGTLAQASLKTFVAYSLVRHPALPLLRGREFGQLASFGIGASLHKLFNFFARKGDYFVIGHLMGAAPLGLYERAYRTMEGPLAQTGHVLATVLFPAVSRIQKDVPRVRSAYGKAMSMTSLVILPVMVMMILLAEELIVGLLGDKWQGAVQPFRILCAFGLFRATYHVAGSFVKATGRIYRLVLLQIVYAGLILGGTWIACSRFGLEEAALAVGLAITVMYLMQVAVANSAVRMPIVDFLALHAAPLVAGALTAAICAALRQALVALAAPRLVVLGAVVPLTPVLLVASLHLLPRAVVRPVTSLLHEVLDQGVLPAAFAEKLRRLLPRRAESGGEERG
jgi:O-antigen/teichoic acid export membrane protein